MDTWVIVLLVVVAVLALLFLGGLIGNARVRREREASLAARIAEADHHLAEARAQDRGWDPERLQAAARTAFAARVPGVEPRTLDLIQVVDRPGTDQDRALMRVTHAAGAEEIELHRTGDEWTAA